MVEAAIEKVGKYSTKDLIKIASCFIIPIILLLIPESATYTYGLKWFLAATVWMLIWAAFEITDLLFPSIIYPIILILAGVVPAATAYASWANMIVPVCAAALCIANVLESCGLLQRVCYWIVMKCGGSFNRTIVALFFACLVLCLMTFATGSVIIATICYGFCKGLGITKTKEACIAMMTGMLAGSTCRMFIYYPVCMGSLLGSTAAVDPTFTITFNDLLLYNWPVLIFCLAFIALMLFNNRKSTTGVSGRGKEYFVEEYKKLGAMTLPEKKAAALVVFLVVAILLSQTLGYDPMVPFIVVVFLMFFPGIDLGSAKNVKDIPIGILFFVGTCMSIGVMCNAVGLTAQITQLMTSMFANSNIFVLLLAVLAFGVIANFAMTPLAMLAAFGGSLLMVANGLGVDPLAVLFTFNMSTDMVFLPYEYATFLVFFAFGQMTTGQFAKYHTAKNLVFTLFFAAIIIPYWMILGLV